jgi:hypothetical protein
VHTGRGNHVGSGLCVAHHAHTVVQAGRLRHLQATLVHGHRGAYNKCVDAGIFTGLRQPAYHEKFTPIEIADRHIKGLCFKCDENFVPGYRDSCKRLFCIELLDEDNDDAEPTISLAALTCIQPNTSHTMHVIVLISNTSLRALLDSGSTHNFIDHVIADHAGVSFTNDAWLRMAVTNEDHLTSPSRCSALDIDIISEHFVICCYGLGLSSFDMVLGVQWL